jgi:preprotein translocase subunit YajC
MVDCKPKHNPSEKSVASLPFSGYEWWALRRRFRPFYFTLLEDSMFSVTSAYAMSGGGGGEAGGMLSFIPLILMFVVFYFLLIRPQQKRAKEHQAMLGSVKRGDEIVTAGGLHGRVLEATEQYLMVDLGDTKVKLSRNAVSAVVGQSKAADKPSKG